MSPVDEVEGEVARLRDLDLVALRARWRVLTGRSAPRHLARHLLLRILGYRIQAEAFGDLSRETIRLLDRLGTGETSVPAPPSRKVRPGTVLVREWNGVRHHVIADRDGYAWNGERYRSLSKVAHAITGTRWSGPRFFGLGTGPSAAPGSQDHGRAG